MDGSEPQGSVRFEFHVTTRVDSPLTASDEPPTVVDAAGEEPKVRAIKDNFGNTFRTGRDAFDGFSIEEAIPVTNGKTVELRVIEMAAKGAENLGYRYELLDCNGDPGSETVVVDDVALAVRAPGLTRDDGLPTGGAFEL